MISEKIFRANDIRGIYNDDLTDETAYIIGKSFGAYAQLKNINKTLVGHDNRLSSPNLHANLIKGLLESGIDVIDLGLVTTPMFYYAKEKLNTYAGLMITASHNPSEYNGFKISFDEKGNCTKDEILKFMNFTKQNNFKTGSGKLSKYNINNEYIDYLVNAIDLGNKKIKLVIDCGNGTCCTIIKDILDRLNVTCDLLYCESDPTFPHHHPDPSISKNLVDLQKRVLELKYDIGIAVDADGDRVRVVDNLGNIVDSDIYMLIMYRYLNKNLKVRKALYDVRCSKILSDELEKINIEPIMYRTGNSYIYQKRKELNVDFAGEYSGHMWFADKFCGIDDGIYAGLRMVEVLSNEERTLNELYKDLNFYCSTDELKLKTTEEKKYIVVEKVKEYVVSKKYDFLDIDGIRVTLNNGWALIRHSNTGPLVTARFEANNNERLEEIQNEFMTIINRYL